MTIAIAVLLFFACILFFIMSDALLPRSIAWPMLALSLAAGVLELTTTRQGLLVAIGVWLGALAAITSLWAFWGMVEVVKRDFLSLQRRPILSGDNLILSVMWVIALSYIPACVFQFLYVA